MNTLEIDYDHFPMNPRTDWDNLSKIFSCHNTVTGDIQAKGGYRSLHAEYLARCGRNNIEVPVYLYEHSGITINTTGFNCLWDSGQLGYIFIDRKSACEQYGWKRLSAKRIEQVKKDLVQEIEVYDKYLSGEAYTVSILDADGEIADSCGSFFNIEEAKEGAEGYFPKGEIDKIFEEALEKLHS